MKVGGHDLERVGYRDAGAEVRVDKQLAEGGDRNTAPHSGQPSTGQRNPRSVLPSVLTRTAFSGSSNSLGAGGVQYKVQASQIEALEQKAET